ncbi:MAG: TolC family protein [Gammaproteobacteria bacterium]|nr:TolC family protein [Gammaproteobacteria bacterium]
MSYRCRLAWSLVLIFPVYLQAAELPENLGFDLLMSVVDEGVYTDAQLLKAEYAAIQSELLNVQGINDFNISLEALAQYVEPSQVITDEVNDDHQLAIVMKKSLLDAGFSNNKEQSVNARIKSYKLLMQNMRLSKRIEAARNFFDIKLADLKYTVDNEAISTAYIKFNKTQERNALKQSSDVELLKAQFEYQQVRARRYESETMQRITRARLAESISRPKELPAEVIVPEFSFINRKRPDYDDLLKRVLANNLQLRLQQLQVEAAAYELAASRKQHGSALSTELEWREYSNELPSRNNWRAAIKYSVPLYENATAKSAVAKALANLKKQQSVLIKLESQIRQQSLEVWQRIYVLKARQDIDEVAEEYRELYQDRSRAYYEMEFRTDLGDSFVRVSEARLEKSNNYFELVIAWMKLAMLSGLTLEEYMQQ